MEYKLGICDEEITKGTQDYTPALCYEEQNALRYAVGYIPQIFEKEIK